MNARVGVSFLKRNNVLSIISWCLYDWACGPFSIIVITFVFSTYFTTKVAQNQITGTYQWASATSLSAFMIALLSPLFGAIADRGGKHKRWLFVCTWIAIIASALLWFAYPETGSIYYMLTCVVIGTIGYEIALVFYNAFLPELAPADYLGRISGWGWGSGYLGGIVALTLVLMIFIKPHPAWLDAASAEQIRICGPVVAIWFALFSLPIFIFAPRLPSKNLPARQAIHSGVKELIRTIQSLPSKKNIFFYLVAHMVYTDGLNTLFAFGGIYAAGTFGLTFEEVLLFGISMNLTAGIGAIALGWMDDYLGSKRTVLTSLVFLTSLGVPLLFLEQKYLFWGVALGLCIFVGPIQSASRSLMVKLLESKETSAEMFGLYALSGKITAFMGPWFLGTVTLWYGSQRAGMATVLFLLAIGALLLLPVKESE